MATAEENVSAAPEEKAPLKETKAKKTPKERRQARADLLTLLLIVLVGVGIVYLGLNVGFAVLGFVLWIIGRAAGVAA